MSSSSKFYKRFSIPHNDYVKVNMCGPCDSKIPEEGEESKKDSTFYTMFKNTTQSYKDEIEDIYFSKAFYYEYHGKTSRFGDVMGKEASNAQVDYLFKLQDEFGVTLSLTVNQENPPMEILRDNRVREEFIAWLRVFYERGLRMTTISHVHLMSSGILQKEFPEMRWKNTVNHIVRTAQEVIDLAALGYTTVLLDRQLNRNIRELKKISHATKERGIKTSLLVSEGCLPSCPFKSEHDEMQPYVESMTGGNYWDFYANFSCNKWHEPNAEGRKLFQTKEIWQKMNHNTTIPRAGVSCVWDTTERFDAYEEVVDIFKFSGRLRDIYEVDHPNQGYKWSYDLAGRGEEASVCLMSADCFTDVYDSGLGYLSEWFSFSFKDNHNIKDPEVIKMAQEYFAGIEHPYKTEAGKTMCAALLNCRSQCYDCHLCEDAYGYEHIDTLCDRNLQYQYKDKKHAVNVMFHRA